ncbi:integrator complex subunit 2 [Agrilus planipennis]|uniref:Integrator complex subunit 2 n=1 Tax=Agrilus planipennis TaxID=224129 RepID=A0A1W4X6V2_AGRPL|nr:integrator complex subunit 2 [Agrilus planipennis]
MNAETVYNISFKKPVSPKVFRAIQNVDIDELSKCTEQEIRPILPCLVRMSLIAPLDTSKKCSKQKIDILTIISGIELVNSIVALLSIDFHALESDVKKEQQLRQKCGTSLNESVLISGLPNGLALEYERSDMTRRLRLVLSELLFIQSQIQESLENTSEHEFYMKQSELFDNDIYIEEISDVICIALAELPTLLNVQNIIETLLHVHNGPAIICRVVANFPDSFREVCTSLIQKGEKQEESAHSAIRLNAISMLCKMNPSEALSVRSKCVELCRMPALAICLSLDHASRCSSSQPEGDMVAFVSGLLLGNDQTVRSWFALFVRTGQKRKGEVSSNILQQLRDDLLRRLQTIIQASLEGQLPDSYVVQASALLRLYCALRGIAGIKFQDEEVNQIVQLLTSHPNPTPAGVRFVSLGLCMLIACPSLASQTEHERRSIEWVQWLVREEAYFESASGVSASFGEMLLLMAIHFHSNQLSAICDLVCATLGMKIPIRHNNMTRMKQVFTQEIFTEQVVTAHAVKVPVTNNLNATMTGFLPIHCIHQLLKSRAFAKHNVNIKNWIYKQICASTSPLHPVLPMLVDVYVNSIVLPSLKNAEHTNKPLSENEIRRVFKSSIFGQYFNQKTSSFSLDFDVTSSDYQDIPVNESSLTPQLLLLYYLLLYEDCRLTNAQQLTASGRKIKRYSAEFLSELPIKYLLYHAQKDQTSYSTLFGPLLKLLATHFPHLTLVDDWLDDMSFKVDEKSPHISELSLVEAFEEVKSNPSGLAKVLQSLLKKEAIDIWPFAEVFTHYVKELLDENVPRHLQDLYKDVWLRLNTVLPRRLWVLTVKSLVGDLTGLVRVDVAEDPLQIMRCDERVFRCAPIYAIILRVLRASLASSRSQLFQHLQTNPKLDHMGQLLNDSEREEMCRALVAAQDSAAVQVLLETCLESEQDRLVPGRLLALQEVRSLVCSYLHQLFIADTTLAKLVHFQGYPSELIEVTVRGVPSMHICLDFLLELMQQPSINKQIFAIQLLSHLSVQYALPKSLNLCVTALNLLYALLGGLSSPQRMKLFKPILPALVRISKAFPPLVDDITQLLLQLAKVCQSQASLTSHFSVHMNWDDELITEESKSLCELAQETFSEIVSQAVLKTDIYN